MTDKNERIRKAIKELNITTTDMFTVKQLEDIARLADVRMIDVMAYLRNRC